MLQAMLQENPQGAGPVRCCNKTRLKALPLLGIMFVRRFAYWASSFQAFLLPVLRVLEALVNSIWQRVAGQAFRECFVCGGVLVRQVRIYFRTSGTGGWWVRIYFLRDERDRG